MAVAFYFYKDRLIHFSVARYNFELKRLIPPTTPDILWPIVTLGKNSRQRWTFFIGDGKYSALIVNKIFGTEDNVNYRQEPYGDPGYIYWEVPDIEDRLRKSGYYELKAKLDKDFMEKKGYWASKKEESGNPNFNEKLSKPSYYELKAKLERDFAEKKGYWAKK